MKKIILLPIMLLLFCSQTQAQTNSSNLVFGGGFAGSVNAIVKAPDGSTFVGGDFTNVDGVTRNHLAKINADGTLNSSFNPNMSDTVYALALDPSGNLYVGGDFNYVGNSPGWVERDGLAKFNADGSLNSSYHPYFGGSLVSNLVNTIVLDTTGNLYVGGNFTIVGTPSGSVVRNHLAKINADGTLNVSFNPNMNNNVSAFALDPSGNLYVGGTFTTVGSVTCNYLAKINADGTLNSSFNPNMNNYVGALALDPSGNLYVGGEFTTVGGVQQGHFAKINANGTLNSSFRSTSHGVHAITLDPSGNLYIGGGFSTVSTPSGSVTRKYLAKINAIGTLDSSFNPNLNLAVYALALDSSGNLYAGGWFAKKYAVFNGVSLGNTVFENDKENATYYPNPTTGILNINYSKEISSVSVVNLLGQTVLTQTTSGMAAQLDLSSLSDGTYIVKMVSEGKTQTFKVIKGL